MTPPFIVQVFKEAFSERPWSNVYLIEAATLAEAEAQAAVIADAERSLHFDVVNFVRYRVSTTTPGDDVFSIVPLGIPGTIDSTGGDFLPLFNTMRVDFAVAGGGRPSRKYYRTPISEGQQTAGLLQPAAVTAFQTAVNEFLTTLSEGSVQWVDPDDQAIVTGIVQAKVQMRQLHRRRKRATTTP